MAHFEIQNLSFSYPAAKGKESLHNVNLTIHRGEYIVLCGKSGSGKTTLLRHLKSVLAPHGKKSGEILFNGIPMGQVSQRDQSSKIGYVMQNPNQMISKPMIYDEVALSLVMQKLPEEEIKERVYEALKICGLYEFRNWPVSALSYGQKKRVTIASILVSRPRILILDEPTAGQDFRHYTEIMEFLKELNEKGYTVLMITHDMHLMLEYTDRSLVFVEGRMIADTTPEKLFAAPELLKRASLKETSLYQLAKQCGLPEEAYIRAFIEYDREVRS